LYLSYKDIGGEAAKVDFPEKVLRGFEKVHLEKDQQITVQFNLTRRDLSYWDVVQQNWVLPTEGKFTISVGASSRDLRVTGSY
jgi:beta-glucosidase